MKENNIEAIFKNVKDTFDIEEPGFGHQDRFLEKLNSNNRTAFKTTKRSLWKPLSIAASIVFICALAITYFIPVKTTTEQITEIAPEVTETKFYFASLINEQVKELKKEDAPETKQIVDDTLLQLKKLEKDYTKLEQNLINGGSTKLILSAIITNFQTRIDLVKEVMKQIDTIKNLKQYNDEKFTI